MSGKVNHVCPHCQHPIAEDFGLISCSFCGASLLVEMDGRIISNEREKSQTENYISELELDPELMPESTLPESELDPTLDSEPEFERKRESDPEQENKLEQENEPLPAYFPTNIEDMEVGDPLPPTPQESASVFAEISAYGNSEQSTVRDGSLRLRLKVSGIDSPELREEIRDALTDKKFLWDVEEIMRSIDSGSLTLDDLSLLKAALLLERIKGLSLDVSWEQYNINR